VEATVRLRAIAATVWLLDRGVVLIKEVGERKKVGKKKWVDGKSG